MPDVNITEPTPNLGNASRAIPGLKHHQLSVLDALPAESKYIRYVNYTMIGWYMFFFFFPEHGICPITTMLVFGNEHFHLLICKF